MQIHELNNFNGQLGEFAFLAVDDGVDTGKVSTESLLNPVEIEINQLADTLNGRIDNIIAGGTAPSAAEVTDARMGESGKVYASLGDAIRAQVGDLKSDIAFTREGSYKLTADDVVQGSYNSSDPSYIYPSTTRLRNTTPVHCYKGDIINLQMGANCNQYAMGFYSEKGTWIREQNWIGSNTITLDANYIIVIAFRNSDNRTLAANDFDANVTFYSVMGKEVENIIAENDATSWKFSLQNMIKKTNDATRLSWQLGYINAADGQLSADPLNMATPMMLFVKAGTTIQSLNGDRFAAVFYSSPFIEDRYDRLNFRSDPWTFTEDTFLRISMLKSDSTEITDMIALASSLQISNGYLYYLDPEFYKEVAPLERNSYAVTKFIEKMNERAQRIGMTNSIFADVAGYDTATNRTTARDLVRLGIDALAYNELCSVWNTDSYTIKTLDPAHRVIVCDYSDDMTELNNSYIVLGKKAGYMPLSGGGRSVTMLAACLVDDEVVVGAVGGIAVQSERVKAMKQLMDIASEIIQDRSASTTPSYFQYGCAAILPKGNPISYEHKNISFIYEYNADTQFVPASTTKTLTAITALDYITDMHSKFEVLSSDGLDYGSGQLLQAGDILNYRQALYLMMLPSSGPCCRVVARTLGQKMLIAYE